MSALDGRVDRLEAALATLAEAQARTEESLGTLAQRVDQLTQRVDQLTAGLAQLTERVDQLTAGLAQLTERVDQLTQRVDQLTARLDQLTARVDQLTIRLNDLTERVDQLTMRVDQLTARVDQLTGRVDDLTAVTKQLVDGMARLDARVGRLETRVERLDTRVGDLAGGALERRYRERAPAYFDDVLRRIHALGAEELAALLDDAEERGAITSAERRDVLYADVIVRGRRRDDNEPAYLAVEVSAAVDEHDVRRAVRRAEALSRAAGMPALPVVAGERIDPDPARLADEQGVWRVLDGRTFPPSPEA